MSNCGGISVSTSSGINNNRWQFWALLIFVFFISTSPALGDGNDPAWDVGAMNAAAIGLVLLGFAVYEVQEHSARTDGGQIALGCWLWISPHVLGYSHIALAKHHLALGTILILLSAVSLLQERLCSLSRDSRRP